MAALSIITAWATTILFILSRFELTNAGSLTTGCPQRRPAVDENNEYLSYGVWLGSSLADGDFFVDIDKGEPLLPVTPEQASIKLNVGTEYLIRLGSSSGRYNGFLIRLEASSEKDTSDALIPDYLSELDSACKAPIVGMTNKGDELKNFANGTIFIENVGLVDLDVTVVLSLNETEPSYFYSRYTLRFVDPDETKAPTVVLPPPTTVTPPTPVTSAPVPISPVAPTSPSRAPDAQPVLPPVSAPATLAPLSPTSPPVSQPTKLPVAPLTPTSPLAPVSPTSPTLLPTIPDKCTSFIVAYEQCVDDNFALGQRTACENCVSASFPPAGSNCTDNGPPICMAIFLCDCEPCEIFLENNITCQIDCDLDCPTNATVSEAPTGLPSSVPVSTPSEMPSIAPITAMPTSAPTVMPTSASSEMPSSAPSEMPNSSPSEMPSSAPSEMPSSSPSEMPSSGPSEVPSSVPSAIESVPPSLSPITPAPDQCGVSQLNVQSCLQNELDNVTSLECATCIIQVFDDVSSPFPNCEEAENITCSALDTCTSCGTCVDEVEEYLNCTLFISDNCSINCGTSPLTCDTEFTTAQTCLQTLLPEDAQDCNICLNSFFPEDNPFGSCEELESASCNAISNCTTCGNCSATIESYLLCSYATLNCTINCNPVENCSPILDDLSTCLTDSSEASAGECLICLTRALDNVPLDGDCTEVNDFACRTISECTVCGSCVEDVSSWIDCSVGNTTGCPISCSTESVP